MLNRQRENQLDQKASLISARTVEDIEPEFSVYRQIASRRDKNVLRRICCFVPHFHSFLYAAKGYKYDKFIDS